MGNKTIVNELFLVGLSDLPDLQLPLFLCFLLIYLLTFIGNILIITLVVTISHLQVPMYFFLGNLAVFDLCFSSAIVPRMLFDLYTQRKKITVTSCIAQVFFFVFFVTAEGFLLTVMSYDRYIAVCQPLHYVQVMSWKACAQLMLSVSCLSFYCSLVHTLYAFQLTFCESDIIDSFFCDLPQLFQISCSDTYINILLTFLLGGFLTGGSLILTFLSYILIFKTVLKMEIKGKRRKVFSTCASHLTVVLMYYGSGFMNYFQPNNGRHWTGDKGVAVFYTVILPFLNPLIYSLRNQDFKIIYKDLLRKASFHKI